MRPEFEHEQSSVLPKILLALGLFAIAGMAYFFWRSSVESKPQIVEIPIPTPIVEPAPVEAEPEPELSVAIEPQVADEPEEPPPPSLPSLDESDEFTLEALANLPNSEALLKLVIPDNVLRKFVRAVMGLDENVVVHDYRPLQSPAPAFKVKKIDESLDIDIGQRYTLDRGNFDRYQPWVTVFGSVDKAMLANVYARFSPLLEEAYIQQGVDRGSFHNVVLSVVDGLLEAPIIEGDIILVQPKVFFQYQDPDLENSPEAHRLLLRMGPENTRAIQVGLQELKQHLHALNLPTESQ